MFSTYFRDTKLLDIGQIDKFQVGQRFDLLCPVEFRKWSRQIEGKDAY